jgi:hypothetical protein
MLTRIVVGYFFHFRPNRGQLAPINFYSQRFNLCFDNFPNTAAFTFRAAPQIAIHGFNKQPAKYPPKKTNEKKGYKTDWEQIC